ncbi:MFS transporter [Haloplanus pelagicus]|uniref:MFS transporter n=1 Tax=Haloplanus pelagicus TaxID=2949995 RepID=UPI00203C26FB|nr:MFS transporter [Haloplanus sp. HW8-1]
MPSGLASRRPRLGSFDVLALTALLWFLAKFLRYAVPPLFGTFRGLYGVSNAELGAMFSALMGGYALMQFPSGALADRIGAVRVIVGGAVVAATATLLLFASTTYAVLVVAVVGVGVGTGAHKTVAITLLTAVYSNRTGRALGVVDTVGEFGGVLAPAVVVAVLAAALPWQSIFLVAALAGLCLAGTFAVRVPRRLSDRAVGTPDDGGVRIRSSLAAVATGRLAAFVVVTVCFAFAVGGVTAFLPLFLERRPGIDTHLAGLLYSAFFVVAAVQPLSGELADRVGPLRVIAGLLCLGVAAVGWLLAAAGPLAVGAATLALGVGLHGVRPGRDAYLMTVIPDDGAGGTLGVVRTIMMGASAVAPAAVGYLSEAATFGVAFGVLAASLAVAAAVVGVLAVTR